MRLECEKIEECEAPRCRGLITRRRPALLASAFAMAALALFCGCVADKSPSRGGEVTVLMLRDLYSLPRSSHDPYGTFQDTGVRVDGAQADKMYQVVARVQSGEAEPCFCGIDGYQLFLRNGEPDVLVELLADDVAIIGKVTRMKVLPGGYYIVSEDRGSLPWKSFKSKWYADCVRELLNLQKNNCHCHTNSLPMGGRR